MQVQQLTQLKTISRSILSEINNTYLWNVHVKKPIKNCLTLHHVNFYDRF